MYDLTHPLTNETPVYPGDPPVSLDPAATHEADGYRVTDLQLNSHAGTHLDAPAHLLADGRTLDDYSVDRFVFDAHVVDCTGLDADAAIRASDLPDPDCELLLVHTGWDTHWGTSRYDNHPHLAPDAAQWCADRGYDLGFDTAGPDPTGAETFPAHRRLFRADCLLVENLTGLDALPERVRLFAFPLALTDADGAPVRAVAEPRE
ncbi:cyclase family protein [Halogranum rubrum]|uniref:Cyclase n=1 Tax=Halogranum salarium B-1 TaxID=1210908 RepID=J3EUX9_9EURY|nr:cyclase family protein [Halogranum salarium]EJN58282.1 cyclase [Halogranum salarium B-1]